MEQVTQKYWSSIEVTLAAALAAVYILITLLLVLLLILLFRYYRKMRRFNTLYGDGGNRAYTHSNTPDEERYCDTISIDLDCMEGRVKIPVNSQRIHRTLQPIHVV